MISLPCPGWRNFSTLEVDRWLQPSVQSSLGRGASPLGVAPFRGTRWVCVCVCACVCDVSVHACVCVSPCHGRETCVLQQTTELYCLGSCTPGRVTPQVNRVVAQIIWSNYPQVGVLVDESQQGHHPLMVLVHPLLPRRVMLSLTKDSMTVLSSRTTRPECVHILSEHLDLW